MAGFDLGARCSQSRARRGRLTTAHGTVQTPAFMPVATQATAKSLRQDDLSGSGAQCILANTYHLFLRPGLEAFEKLGGLHQFMDWDGSIITDSGGFQVFSLARDRRITEDGAVFKSYVDGRSIALTPELSIRAQRAIGADIMMAFDQCVQSTVGFEEAKAAMELTHRWALRSLRAKERYPGLHGYDQALFGIVQGACFEGLRAESARFLSDQAFDGFAIGGLAVGESKTQREDFTELTAALLPEDRARYLMGVGTPIDLLEAVWRGVDLFDCILPTSMAQRGFAFTSKGKVRITRQVYRLQEQALDPNCGCPTCARFSRAYLHHLMKAQEPLGWTLLSTHNTCFYQNLMRRIRDAVEGGAFAELYRSERGRLALSDEDHPPVPERPLRARSATSLLSVLREGERHEVVASNEGAFGFIRAKASREIMHRSKDPNQESRLYLEGSGLSRRVERHAEPAVIWDVGLGAAHNLSCTVQFVEKTGLRARIVSFEKDLEPLQLACEERERFPHLKALPDAFDASARNLERGVWSWELRVGDFFELLESAPAPDYVFWDPFSIKSNPEFWTQEAFLRLRAHAGAKPLRMITFSSATRAREALLKAGFFVCEGPESSTERRTTLAIHSPGGLSELEPWEREALLGERWLARWARGARIADPGAAMEAWKSHPQFAACVLGLDADALTGV